MDFEMTRDMHYELIAWEYIIRDGPDISQKVSEMPNETIYKLLPLLARLERMRNLLSQPERDVRYFVTMRLLIEEFKQRKLDPCGLESLLNAKW